MKKKIIIFTFFAVFLIISFFSMKLWNNLDFIDISIDGIFAIFICAIMSFIIGSGLMALAFFSSRYGYDEKVDHDLETLIDRYKKL